VAYEWTVFATLATLLVAVVALLATALFRAKIDRLADRCDQRFDRVDQQFDRVDQRFERVDQRFDRLDQRMREDKAELLARLDVLAERLTRLEAS
jgi:iron uptake system EfeUOB component EfeO/EfeM